MRTLLVLLLSFCLPAFGRTIEGFWKVPDDDNAGSAKCAVAIYSYEGKYYGRIIATYKDGTLDATLEKPKSRAEGLKGKPFYAGLDFIYNLSKEGDRYRGKIVDPRSGKVYDAQLWMNGEDLIVRGELWIFGKSYVWHPLKESEFSPVFKKPNVRKFTPTIPEKN